MASTPEVLTPSLITPNVQKIKAVLEGNLAKIAEVCSKNITPEVLFKSAMTMVYKTPKLQECEPASFAMALLDAARCGVEFGEGQEAYLIPYKNGPASKRMQRDVYECQFRIGYRGLVKVAIETGAASVMDAHVVYEKDEFTFGYGIVPWIEHRPKLGDRGKPVAAYCAGKHANGEPFLDVLSLEDIEKARSCSQSSDSLMWTKFWGEGARKTAIRRMAKRLRGNPRLAMTIAIDETEFKATVDAATALPERPMPKRLAPVDKPVKQAPHPLLAEILESDEWLDMFTELRDIVKEERLLNTILNECKESPDPLGALRDAVQSAKGGTPELSNTATT